MNRPFISLPLLFAFSLASADELRFAGSLGNSGAEGEPLVSFAGKPATGMGPVLDESNTLWERGGTGQLNRYALDGRLLANFELPGQADRNDVLTLAGDRLVMRISKTIYTLPLEAEPGARPEKLRGNVETMASGSWDGKVLIYERETKQISWLDPMSDETISVATLEDAPHAMFAGEEGTAYAFSKGQVFAWKDGEIEPGFPRGSSGERPHRIGDYWYSFAWHGTINRFNAQFEPQPGVVLGGASGSFIGYLPQSADITNGRGIVEVREGVFAVSGMGGVVQLLEWNPEELRFMVARRIGALEGLTGLALDEGGNIWTPRGSWRWEDTPESPHSIGDKEPEVIAQPVMLDGRTMCLLKKHYSYVQLAAGKIIDENDWSHLDQKGVKDFELSENVTGAAALETDDGLLMVVTERDGTAYEFGINQEGRQRTTPREVVLPGLKDCNSLAALGGKLWASTSTGIISFERGDSGWTETGTFAGFEGDTHIHSDGSLLAVSDAEEGAVHLFRSPKEKVATYTGLDSPLHVAVAGDRVAVYEEGKQRIVKLEFGPDRPSEKFSMVEPFGKGSIAQHTESDFEDWSRPGGISLAVAVTSSTEGMTVSLQTSNHPDLRVQLGVADSDSAFILTNDDAQREGDRLHFLLPAGEWANLRLAVMVGLASQRERFGFTDDRPIHAAFSRDPNDWEKFDLEAYRVAVHEKKQEIRLTFEQPVAGKATVVIEDGKGNRIRNLVSGRTFGAGKHTVVWDGLDETGNLVAPGTYQWRGVTHPGITPEYKMHFANGGEETTAPWGPNHSTFRDATSNGDLVFFAAPVTEGGWALVALNAAGEFVQGYDHQHGFGIEHDAIAADEKYLYCAQDGFTWGGTKGIDFKNEQWTSEWTITVVRYDIKTGKMVEFPGSKRAIEVDILEVGPGSDHPDTDDFNLGGIAVSEGKLYVGVRSESLVLVLDAETGERLERIPVENVRHLAVGPDDVVYAANRDGVIRLSDRKLVVPARSMNLRGLTIAENGDILVSDEKSHQIHRFDSKGEPLGVIGVPGGPYKGAYDPNRMVNPGGLAFDSEGKLWVTEDRWNPKRLLAWDLEENQVVYEKFGMPHYGGDGSGFDPENPRRWIGLGCFWDVDIEKGTARPTHILSMEEGHFGKYHPNSYQFFREHGRTFVCARGKITLISEVMPDGTLHDMVAATGTHYFGYGCGWDPPQAYIDAFYEKCPEKWEEEEKGRRKGEGKPWSQRGMGVFWLDRNGDGDLQKEEFEFCGDDLAFGSGAWGGLQSSLTLRFPLSDGKQVSLVTLAPKGFLPNGVPEYPPLEEALASAQPISLTPGYKRNDVATISDRHGRFLFNSDPEMNAYGPKGEHLWSYPNEWSNVHGSHKAPLPEPGVMQGTLGILGCAEFDETSDVIFLNGNHGRCFLLTTDGLYLDEAFVDVRVSYLKNEYRLGGEIFGGSFGRARDSGRYYVQIGHGPYRIYELNGIEEAQRMKGTLEVSAEQITAAEERNLRRAAETHAAKEIVLPAKVDWDKSGQFRSEVEVKADATHLHLHWRVQDPSPWVNNGRNWAKLFATGDTVDLQIAVDPDADPARRSPVEGDKRLLISQYEGQPLAVLYEHRKTAGGNSIVFTSPWRGEKVDNVEKLEEAEIEIKTSRNGYEVIAAIPLAVLGIHFESEKTYRADFGVTFGDAEGTDTNLRSYWSNQSTGLVDDIPGEIMLSPNLWGTLKPGP